jgi:hypothetical protein
MKNKKIPTTLFPAATAIILFSGLLTPAFAESYKKEFYLNAEIGRWWVRTPAGYFLLIRKDNTACAIRFTDFNISHLGAISKEVAEYDYFGQTDGSSNFKKSNLNIGHGKLKQTDLGHSTPWIPPAQNDINTIKCGALTLRWFGLVGVSFYEGAATTPDEGIELAPTKWSDINEIDFGDPKLTWYRYDKTRQYTQISIENLW